MKHTSLFVLLLSSTAYAQPVASPFVTLDRGDGVSKVGVEGSFMILDEDADGQAFRLDLHGQYVDPASGFGGYASVPMTFVTGDNDSNTELAGIEVGGLFAKQLSPEVTFVGRAGVVLPTAGDDFTAVFQNAIVSYARPTDFASVSPNTLIRLSGAPLIRSGQLFARIDVGVDVAADGDEGDDTAILRVGPGVGFDAGSAIVMGELTTLREIGGDDDNEFLTVGAVSARFPVGRTSPYVAFVVPFDDQVRELITGALTLGVEGSL